MDPEVLALLQIGWACETTALRAMIAQVAQTLRVGLPSERLAGASRSVEPMDPMQVVDGVAVIDIAGVLMKSPSFARRYWGEGPATLGEIQGAVERAAEDSSVRGILLRIESPGGSVSGTAELADAVYAARAKKPVLASVPDCCASAAYWIGSQAHGMYAARTAQVGSIGAYMVAWDDSKMYEEAGVKVHLIKAGEFKGAGQSGTEITPAQLAEWQRGIDAAVSHFTDAVARGRGMSPAQALAERTGQMHIAGEAQRRNLIDGVEPFAATLARLRGPASGPAALGRGGPARASARTVIVHSGSERVQPALIVAADVASRGASAIVRSIAQEISMHRQLRAFLQALGLAATASDAEARTFLNSLTGPNRLAADHLQAALPPDEGEPAGGAGQGAAAAAGASGGSVGSGAAVAVADGDEEEEEGAVAVHRIAPPAGPTAQEVLAGERARVKALRTVAAQVRLDPAVLQTHIDDGTSVDRFREVALAHASANMQPVAGLVTGGADARETAVAGIEDALAMRMGIAVEKPHARASEFVRLPLVEVSRRFLGGLGVRASAMGSQEIAQLVLNRQALASHIGGLAFTHTTSDFPGVLGNVLRKVLLPTYLETESTWETWAETLTVNDFKEVTAYQLGVIATPPKVLEGAEYTYGTFGEKGEKYSVAKYGVLVAMTWEMMINDDLGAFTGGVLGFSASSKRLENDLIYGQLTSNPTMNEDGVALFHATHNNLSIGGAAAVSSASLSAARKAMRLQKGIAPKTGVSGPVLAIRPQVILVPETKFDAAQQVIASPVDPTKNNSTPNYKFLQNLDVVSEPRLDDDSTTAWYMVGQRNSGAKTGAVIKLRGYENPTVSEAQQSVSVDGVVYKLRHVCGAKILDWRGLQKNAGA